MTKTIEIKSKGFSLTLSFLSRSAGGTYDDWLHCAVEAHTSGFSANYTFKMLTDELIRFHEKLKAIQKSVGKEAIAELTDRSGPDEYFNLSLKFNKLGHIEGHVMLNNVQSKVSLETEFATDQTVLEQLIDQINAALPIQ